MALHRYMQPIDRFAAKVKRDPATGCLEWQPRKHPQGYGLFKVGGRDHLAHRWIFQHQHGYLPEVVRHSCDNPPCVEIRHLLGGTQADNVQDMTSRNRQSRGESSGLSKLSAQQVADIRAEHAKGNATQKVLAEAYGVSRGQVSRIVNNKRWNREKEITQ